MKHMNIPREVTDSSKYTFVDFIFHVFIVVTVILVAVVFIALALMLADVIFGGENVTEAIASLIS